MEIARIKYLRYPKLTEIKAIDEPHKITIHLLDGGVIPSRLIDDYEAIESGDKLYQTGTLANPDMLVIDMKEGSHQQIHLDKILKIDIEFNKPYNIPG